MTTSRTRSTIAAVALSAMLLPVSVAHAAPTADAATTSTASTVAGSGLNTSDMDNRLKALVSGDVVGAASAAITPEGHWAYTAGDVANEHNNFMKSFATSRAASVTKTVVATLILQGVEQNRWTLDTKVSDLYPDLMPAQPNVTVRMLLNHTSGFPDYIGMPDFESGLLVGIETLDGLQEVTSKQYSHKDLLDIANSRKWRFEPGTAYDYSNSNYVALSEILERSHGKPLGNIAWGRIFAPLGMWRTSIPTTPTLHGAHLKTTMHELEVTKGHPQFNPTVFSGAGALVTTPNDINKFHQALGQGKLISKDLVSEMRTPSAHSKAYGMGTFRVVDPCSTKENPTFLYGHDGAGFGEWAMSMSRPDGSAAFTTLWAGRRYDKNWAAAPQAGFAAFFDLIAKTCTSSGPATTKSERSATTTANVQRTEFINTLTEMHSQRGLVKISFNR